MRYLALLLVLLTISPALAYEEGFNQVFTSINEITFLGSEYTDDWGYEQMVLGFDVSAERLNMGPDFEATYTSTCNAFLIASAEFEGDIEYEVYGSLGGLCGDAITTYTINNGSTTFTSELDIRFNGNLSIEDIPDGTVSLSLNVHQPQNNTFLGYIHFENGEISTQIEGMNYTQISQQMEILAFLGIDYLPVLATLLLVPLVLRKTKRFA